MEITQQVRDYAKKQGLDEAPALERGMVDKAEEFRSKGSTLYVKP
jgi:phosphomethylpyrimidine synthase